MKKIVPFLNRLLTALCCFVHDHDSMQVMYGQGLIDSLLYYLNESATASDQDDNGDRGGGGGGGDDDDSEKKSQFEKRLETAQTNAESKRVSLKKLLFTCADDVSECTRDKSKKWSNKRKSESINSLHAKTRRLDRMDSMASSLVDVLTSPSPLRHSSTSPSLVVLETAGEEGLLCRRDSMSPTTESYMSLSPTGSSCLLFSPSFSASSSPPPPYLHSPPMRTNSTTVNYFSNLSPSGSVSMSAGLSLSPPTYLGDEFGSASLVHINIFLIT